MRKAFIKTLTQLVRNNRDIYLLTGDLGFSVFDEFKEIFPDNYLNVGLSESNMIGIAAGMALRGKQVFVYSIIPFIIYRALEQIRNDLCYQELPVKIIGVGEGLSYGVAGTTHHAVEDIAIMTALPNMTVIAPGDPLEVKYTIEQSLDLKNPCYIRLGKTGEPILYKKESIPFKIGKAIVLKKGKDVSLFATGNMLETALQISRILERENISSEVISMHTLKPIDRDAVIKSARASKIIVSIEEHVKAGGLGNKIANILLGSSINTKFLEFALPDNFVHEVGNRKYLREFYGLLSDQIAKKIIKIGRNII